jgi:hypothetical protein
MLAVFDVAIAVSDVLPPGVARHDAGSFARWTSSSTFAQQRRAARGNMRPTITMLARQRRCRSTRRAPITMLAFPDVAIAVSDLLPPEA